MALSFGARRPLGTAPVEGVRRSTRWSTPDFVRNAERPLAFHLDLSRPHDSGHGHRHADPLHGAHEERTANCALLSTNPCRLHTVLVLGKNLPVMFVGWEGVVSAVLPIGFWFSVPSATDAGKKVVNPSATSGSSSGALAVRCSGTLISRRASGRVPCPKPPSRATGITLFVSRWRASRRSPRSSGRPPAHDRPQRRAVQSAAPQIEVVAIGALTAPSPGVAPNDIARSGLPTVSQLGYSPTMGLAPPPAIPPYTGALSAPSSDRRDSRATASRPAQDGRPGAADTGCPSSARSRLRAPLGLGFFPRTRFLQTFSHGHTSSRYVITAFLTATACSGCYMCFWTRRHVAHYAITHRGSARRTPHRRITHPPHGMTPGGLPRRDRFRPATSVPEAVVHGGIGS